ncbi:MAG TPA: CoA pyrophosphatase [Polyangiaceae bacterium]|nr:CoA pyrophosphatase [Polyangiaceae bacterium]
MSVAFDLATISSRLSRLEGRADPPAPFAGRHAAVAAVLREPAPGEGVELLLIKRAEHPDDPWSGHMALPGGRHDEGDGSLLATAVRETYEEVGIDLAAQGALLGRLESVEAVAKGRRVGLTITPFVFALRGEAPLRFDEREVAEAFWSPLAPLALGEAAGTYPYRHEGVVYDLPCLHVGERVVWGLTYRMLQLFFEALRAG